MRRSLAALLTAAALLVASGCGSDTSPADDVPALATSLDAVDEAVASGDDAAVRDAVDELVVSTARAEAAGDLEPAQADRIVAAAEALLAALGESEPAPAEDGPQSPSPEPPSPEPASPEPFSDEGDDGDDGDDGEDDEDEDEDEEGKKPRGPKKSKGKKKH